MTCGRTRTPGKAYKIKLIPTQIFFDASGKERFRHEGFFGKEDILAKWKELGVDLKAKASAGIVRETPVAADTRPRESVCFMCDGDVNAKTKTVVKGQSEQRVLCGPHCYFIYFSSIVGADPKAEEAKVSVTDWASGKPGAGEHGQLPLWHGREGPGDREGVCRQGRRRRRNSRPAAAMW